MNKAFYISSLVLSVLFVVVIIYYIDRVVSSRYSFWYSGTDETAVRTREAAWVSLFFFSFFGTTFLLGLVKIQRVTNKILSIIGLALSALFVLWDLAMLSSAGRLSFDEVGVGFFFFTPVILAFSIVGIVQSNRYKRQGALYKKEVESKLLDS